MLRGTGTLTFLVGPNGAGKSNLIDALRLVKESLDISFEQAIRMRAGAKEVRRRSFAKEGKKGKGRPTNFGIRLEFGFGTQMQGSYSFQVGSRANGVFVIEKEECRWSDGGALDKAWFLVKHGKLENSSEKEHASCRGRPTLSSQGVQRAGLAQISRGFRAWASTI